MKNPQKRRAGAIGKFALIADPFVMKFLLNSITKHKNPTPLHAIPPHLQL
jgi:hypothetical protein